MKRHAGRLFSLLIAFSIAACSFTAYAAKDTFSDTTIETLPSGWKVTAPAVNPAADAKVEVVNGMNALVLKKSAGSGYARAERISSAFNGNPAIVELQFSYKGDVSFRFRQNKDGGELAWMGITDNELRFQTSDGNGGFTYPGMAVLNPSVVHTLRIEACTQSWLGTTGLNLYLDGEEIGKNLKFTVPSDGCGYGYFFAQISGENSELDIYKYSHSSVFGNKNVSDTFEDGGYPIIGDGVTEGWTFTQTGENTSVDIETKAENTAMLKISKPTTGTENSATVTKTLEQETSSRSMVTLKFSTEGTGTSQLRFLSMSNYWLAQFSISGNKMSYSTGASTQTVVKNYLAPFTEHTMVAYFENGYVTAYLDDSVIVDELKYTSGGDPVGFGKFLVNCYGSGRPAVNIISFEAGDVTYSRELDVSGMSYYLETKTDPILKIESGKIIEQVDIANNTKESETVPLIMAKYVDGKLTEVVRDEQSINIRENKTYRCETTVTEDLTKTKLRMFLWKGVDLMTPLGTSLTLDTEENTYKALAEKAIVDKGDMSRIAAAMRKAENGGDITIGAIGDSITEGSGASSADSRYADLVENWWKEKFPEIRVTCVNAGVGGTDSYLGVHRLNRELLSYNPDFVVVDFAVNDGGSDNQNYSY